MHVLGAGLHFLTDYADLFQFKLRYFGSFSRYGLATWRSMPNLAVGHVQEKLHKHSHVSHRKDVPWKQAVETDSIAPLVHLMFNHKL